MKLKTSPLSDERKNIVALFEDTYRKLADLCYERKMRVKMRDREKREWANGLKRLKKFILIYSGNDFNYEPAYEVAQIDLNKEMEYAVYCMAVLSKNKRDFSRRLEEIGMSNFYAREQYRISDFYNFRFCGEVGWALEDIGYGLQGHLYPIWQDQIDEILYSYNPQKYIIKI